MTGMDEQTTAIGFVRAPDDPQERDPAFQEELNAFGSSLREAGVAYSQRAMVFDSIDALGYPLGEFIIKQLGPVAIPAVTGAVGVWLQARYGRKVRLKVGDVEIEARIPEEIERLLKSAASLRDNSSDTGKAP